MGKAIIINGLDFSNVGLGKVTIFEPSPLVSLSIIGDSEVNNEDNTATFNVDYNPPTTDERGVVWSIVNGGEYATIDSNTGVLSVLDGALGAIVVIRATSVFNESVIAEKSINVTYNESHAYPIHTGAKYFMPLLNSSDSIDAPISVNKENTSYSEEGALFDQSGEGICYELPSGDVVKAFAFDFYKHNYGLANGNYFANIGTYAGVTGTPNGFYAYTGANNNAMGISVDAGTQTRDQSIGTPFTMDAWHRMCVAFLDGKVYLYIDGQLVVNGTYSFGSKYVNYNIGYFILGNAWRYRVDNGDRAFGGKMKNLAIWTNEISLEDIVSFSTLSNNE